MEDIYGSDFMTIVDEDGTEYELPCQMINCFCMFSDYEPLSLDEWIENDRKRRDAMNGSQLP